MSAPGIFLSYNREDAAIAKLYADAFAQAGLDVWWDQTLKSGEAYDKVTEAALRGAKAVVVLWSPRSVDSRWVRIEATIADRAGTLMPVTIEPCERPIMFELTQTADLSHWRGDGADTAWQTFLGDVRRKSGQEAGAVPPGDPDSCVARPAAATTDGGGVSVWRRRWLRRATAAGLFVLLLAVAIFGARAIYLAAPWRSGDTNPQSIAVMPFANLTGDASKDYLGDGMAEEVINTLTKVPGLKVPARTSTFAYKGRNTDIRQIARDLGVGTILEGSVREAGNRIRVTAQLIDAKDGLHIWSQTYDEQFTDLFALQDKLATEIATALQPNLHNAVEAAVAQGPPTQNVEAYNLFLQGVSLGERSSAQNATKALAYFQQALARDPKFARAYVGIAGSQMSLAAFGAPPAEHLAAAERAARQALALDPHQAGAHMLVALLYAQRNQFLEMEPHRQAAVSLAPNDGVVRTLNSAILIGAGHIRQGLSEAEKAYALAPASPRTVASLGYAHTEAGNDGEAVKYANAARDLGYPINTWPLPTIYELSALRNRRFAEAATISTSALDARDPDQARTAEVVRLAYAALADPRQRDAALAARTRLYAPSVTEAFGGQANALSMCLRSGLYYALMGAIDLSYGLGDQCFDASKAGKGIVASNASLGLGLFVPELRSWRQDPRFQVGFMHSDMWEYWQRYGPPDDCELKADKLTCH